MRSRQAKSGAFDGTNHWAQANGRANTTARIGTPVLVVEDDAPIRESLAQVLREEGYRVTVAQDGIEALNRLAETRERHIIFIDLLMPRMDGIEFCERLMSDISMRHDHALILMSAWFQHAIPGAAGESARLYKPFDLEDVLELARRYSASPAG